MGLASKCALDCSLSQQSLAKAFIHNFSVFSSLGLVNDKDSKDSMTEGETLEEDEEEEEVGVEIEEQSGNESEINEPEEEVILFPSLSHWVCSGCVGIWLAIADTAINKTLTLQEGSDNDDEEGEEEEEENTDYLTDSNKENETDEENTVCTAVLRY